MTLLPGLLKPSSPPVAPQAQVRVQLNLPPQARSQLEQQLQTLPLPQLLTVGSQNEDGTTPLTLQNGTVVQARISPSLNPGSQVTLTQVPARGNADAAEPAILSAQLTLAAPKGVNPATLAQAMTQQGVQPQAANPPVLNLANVQVVGGNVQLAMPNVLPQGPVTVTMPMPQVTQLLMQLPPMTPLTLIPNGQPMTAEGQPAFLNGGGLPRFVPVTVQTGQPLPTNIAVTVLTPDAEVPVPNKGLTMLMTLAGETGFTPPAATPANVAAAATPMPTKVQLEGLKLLFGMGGQAAPQLPPAGTPFAARILTPPLPASAVAQMGLPVGTIVQTAVLSTGNTVQIQLPPPPTGQSPTPLPAGTVLTMALDFSNNPVGTAPTVLRLSPTNAQPQQTNSNPLPSAPHTQVQTMQAPPPVGTLVQATVTGQTTSSPAQAVLTLNTPPFAGQTFTLPLGQSLPVGTQVQLQFGSNLQATLLNFVLPPNFLRSQAATTLAHQWPMLAQSLQGMGAQAAQHIPTPTNFLATFLPYAKSLMEGQPEVPLTKEAAMRAAALGLDFTPDLQQLTALAAKPENPEQWRGVLFPYIQNPEADPQQGRFFWRQQKQDGREDARSSTRFVVEFSLTNMGDLQLDGLVNYPDVQLKLRGHKPFPPEMRAEIAGVVKSTLEGLGLTGGISLEETPVFALNPLAELLREDPTSLNLSL